MSYKPLTTSLLSLTDKDYDLYNVDVLPQIKRGLQRADVFGRTRVETFEQVLAEELPHTTARRAYRTAILVAMGEEGVVREYKPKPKQAPRKKS